MLVHRRCSSQVLGEDSIIILHQAFVLRGYRTGALHQSIVEHDLLDLRLKGKDRRAQACRCRRPEGRNSRSRPAGSCRCGPSRTGSTGSHESGVSAAFRKGPSPGARLSRTTSKSESDLLGLGLLRGLSNRAEPFLKFGGLFLGRQQAVELRLNRGPADRFQVLGQGVELPGRAIGGPGSRTASPAPIAAAFVRIDSSNFLGRVRRGGAADVHGQLGLLLGRGQSSVA